MGESLITREERKDYARERPSKWLTAYQSPCVSRQRCEKRTPERSLLAGCKREHLVHGCSSARYVIPECDANGDLDLSICAIVHDVHFLCSLFARSLCFHDGVCTVGKLSRRAATTGREGYDCANSGDSWSHVDVIANTNGELKR